MFVIVELLCDTQRRREKRKENDRASTISKYIHYISAGR
jgi:hypothetical protein